MIYLGTTGWSFDFWDGSFYPQNFSGNKLEYYSDIAAFTELRSTYNRIPKKDKVKKWYDSTPEDFIFVGRMLREVTYNSKSIKEDMIKEYFSAFEELDNKLKMVLLHFPMKFQKGKQSYSFLLELLDTVKSKFDGQILVEAPNRSWQKIEVKEALHERSACLVGNDRRPIPSLMRDPKIYFLRLLGDKRTVPRSKFGENPLDRDDDIKYWAKHVKFIDKLTDAVYVSIDNHFSGNSSGDAFFMGEWFQKLNVGFKGFQKVSAKQTE